MKITHIRNATVIVQFAGHHILVDPMLAPKSALPPLRFFDGKRQRNPTVDLPPQTESALEQVTHCLITHCQKGHFDHLDSLGKQWLRERQIPVICTPHDAAFLRKRGLLVQPLPEAHDKPSPLFGGSIRTVRCTHGEGLVGRVMEHGVGYFLEIPGEPSLYLAGDTVLTTRIRDFVLEYQPQVCVVPAGGARMDLGQDIIMGLDEVIAFTTLAKGDIVANHMEAISHCPVSRSDLQAAAARAGLTQRLHTPADGQTLAFHRRVEAMAA